MKGKLVSVSYKPDGTCEKADLIINVDEKEYKKLKNEVAINIQKELEKEAQKKAFEEKVSHHLEKTPDYVLLLAKTIYDNFVDRGLLDDDSEFQKSFYDYIFNGKDLCHEPKEFLEIVKRIGE